MKGRLLTGIVALVIVSNASASLLPDSVTSLLRREPVDSPTVVRLNAIAFAYLKSDPIAGRELAERTMELAKQINFQKGYARAMNIKGSSFYVIGEFESALEYYQLCAKACSAINDEQGLAEAYHNIGEVHKKLKDYRKAIRFLKISLDWDRKNDVNHAITLFNIGEAYFERDELEEALLYFNEALDRSIAEGDIRTTAYSYNGLGKLERQKNNSAKALLYFGKAEALWKDNGELRALIQTYQDMAITYLKLQELGQASAHTEMAMALADSVGANDLQVDNYELQSDIYYAGGDFRKSADYLRLRSGLRDSLYDVNRSQQIARLQVAFATDAQVIENEQLRAARALQDAKLRAQGFMIVAISGGLLIVGLLAIVFFRQRKKIFLVNALLREKTTEVNRQKEEIEFQATALKNLNEALQDLNRSLEARIEERTHQLWWKNQKLADYAHTNSHKLRAPVASILGLIQLMQRIELRDEDKILLEKLIVCAKDLDKITHDINQNLEQDPELADAVQRTITVNR